MIEIGYVTMERLLLMFPYWRDVIFDLTDSHSFFGVYEEDRLVPLKRWNSWAKHVYWDKVKKRCEQVVMCYSYTSAHPKETYRILKVMHIGENIFVSIPDTEYRLWI